MKILKIENGAGYFNIADPENWDTIDKIDKDSLMKLLNLFLEKDVEMDDHNNNSLSNQAHLIIYRSIYSKLKNLEESKNRFKDEADRTYLDAIQKYSAS